jgi:hypothetical protein
MFIDTTSPELQNFDPEASGLSLPPVGVYRDLILQIINTQQGETDKGYGKFDITYEILSGELNGQLFKLTYNTGHSNPDTAKWAVQDVLRVAYAATGIKNHGRGFEFNEKLHKIPFNGTLTITAQTATDANGNPYRNGKLTALKPLDNNQPAQNAQYQQPPAQQAQYQQQPVQNQQYQPPQGQQNGTPSWANK